MKERDSIYVCLFRPVLRNQRRHKKGMEGGARNLKRTIKPVVGASNGLGGGEVVFSKRHEVDDTHRRIAKPYHGRRAGRGRKEEGNSGQDVIPMLHRASETTRGTPAGFVPSDVDAPPALATAAAPGKMVMTSPVASCPSAVRRSAPGGGAVAPFGSPRTMTATWTPARPTWCGREGKAECGVVCMQAIARTRHETTLAIRSLPSRQRVTHGSKRKQTLRIDPIILIEGSRTI